MDRYVHQDTFCFDKQTGEIFHYEVGKYKQDTTPIFSRHYTDSRSVEELNECVKRYNERKTTEIKYNLDKDWLKDRYFVVLHLCSMITYFNVGFYSREMLCSNIGVEDSNLNRYLNKLVSIGLFQYSGKNLEDKHLVRIVWNPTLVWKGWNDVTRMVAIEKWYSRKNIRKYHLSVDINQYTSPLIRQGEYDYVGDKVSGNPDVYVQGRYVDMDKQEDKVGRLLSMNDIDFELYLLDMPSKISPIPIKEIV